MQGLVSLLGARASSRPRYAIRTSASKTTTAIRGGACRDSRRDRRTHRDAGELLDDVIGARQLQAVRPERLHAEVVARLQASCSQGVDRQGDPVHAGDAHSWTLGADGKGEANAVRVQTSRFGVT